MLKKTPALLVVLGFLVCAPTDHADTGRCPAVIDRTMSYAIGIAVIPADDGVSGAYAFTGAGEVLKVVDVSDPAHPFLAGRLVLPDTITAIASREDHLYVWTGTRRLNVIDARVPEDPRPVGWVDLEDVNLEFPRIEVAGDHVFISPGLWGWFGLDPAPGVRVIDVGNADAPVEVARIDGAYGDTAISGSTLYALTNEANAGWRIDLYDVSDPTAPNQLAAYWGPSNDFGQRVMAEGAFVFVGSINGLEIIDFSDPAEPFQAGASGTLHLRPNVALSEGHIFTHVGSIFEVIDVRDPQNPVLCGTCETPWTYGEPEAMVVVGRLVFLAHAYQGLVVVDVGDPSNPSVIGQLTEGAADDVAAAGRYVVRLQRQFGWPSSSELQIADLGAPGGPEEIGRYEIDWGLPTRLAVAGSSVYLMSRSGAVEAVDISDPSAPRQAGRLEAVIGLSDIAAADGVVYLAGDGRRPGCRVLQILDAGDLNDPGTDPDQRRNYAVICDLGQPISVAVSGSYAFLGTESALAVIDISDPSAPFEVARVATPARAVAIQRDHAYVAAGANGLRVYDVRVPTAPQLVSELVLPETFWGPGEAGAVTVVGRRAYLGSSQLQVVDIGDPSRPRVLWTYPRVSDLTYYWYWPGFVSDVAVAGSGVFLAQWLFGSTILDISGCGQPRRDPRRTRFGNP